jgi:hypothetical protein
VCAHLKISPEKVVHEGLEILFKKHEEYDRTGKYPIRNQKTGKLEIKKISLRELRRHLKADAERFDEEGESNLGYEDEPL